MVRLPKGRGHAPARATRPRCGGRPACIAMGGGGGRWRNRDLGLEGRERRERRAASRGGRARVEPEMLRSDACGCRVMRYEWSHGSEEGRRLSEQGVFRHATPLESEATPLESEATPLQSEAIASLNSKAALRTCLRAGTRPERPGGTRFK
jgi:hypothetical protein